MFIRKNITYLLSLWDSLSVFELSQSSIQGLVGLKFKLDSRLLQNLIL
jgi:hypothetical protein